MTAIDLTDFDVVLINSSGGKDSQAMLSHLVGLADTCGTPRSRFVVVHADLGRAEWPGTAELASEHARHYGLRFEVVRRQQGDLIAQIEARGMFPSSAARYCTSDQKTSQVTKLMTRLAAEHRSALQALGKPDRPIRILNCLGIRAQESPARARKVALGQDPASNGRRQVTRWLPIFAWTHEQVWAQIATSGLRHHPAYDAGMSRLSCVFCVLASTGDLKVAAKLNPGLADEYIALEQRIGHRFKADMSLGQILNRTPHTVKA